MTRANYLLTVRQTPRPLSYARRPSVFPRSHPPLRRPAAAAAARQRRLITSRAASGGRGWPRSCGPTARGGGASEFGLGSGEASGFDSSSEEVSNSDPARRRDSIQTVKMMTDQAGPRARITLDKRGPRFTLDFRRLSREAQDAGGTTTPDSGPVRIFWPDSGHLPVSLSVGDPHVPTVLPT